jgi:hypothetical protein
MAALQLRGRYRARVAAGVAAAALALAGGLTARANVVGGIGGCAWTNGPTTADTGCAYTATAPLATAAWLGGNGTATITGSGGQQCVGAAGACATVNACVGLNGVGGVCAYTQTPGSKIGVAAPGSIAGLAGAPQAADTATQGEACIWIAPAGGCTFTVVDNYPVPTLVEVAWVNGPTPTVNGTTPFFCNANNAAAGAGDCTYAVKPAAPGTMAITISASTLSAGVATKTTL